MFGKAAETPRGDHRGHSVLQEGVTIRGELEAKGDVRLDGRFEGKIIVSERLTVGGNGTLVANVEVGEAIVMGSVHGNILASKRLEIRKGAVVVGDVTTPVLVIEEGVRFHGHSNMESEIAAKPILHLPEPSARDSRIAKSDVVAKADP
jgi:cytoskeletal protein CcmA (bactofilin family)